MVRQDVPIKVRKKTSTGFLSGQFSRYHLWLAILFGGTVFSCALYFLHIPEQLQRGEDARIAIRLLDAMRRPMLEIKGIEAQFIETGGSEKTIAALNETTAQAEQLLDNYRHAASYNTKLVKRIDGLTLAYRNWVKAERLVMAHAASADKKPSDTHLAEHLTRANTLFLSAMAELGKGEPLIHKNLQEGQHALYILQWSGASLATYLFILILLHQRAANRLIAAKQQDLDTTLHCIGDAVIATDTQGRIKRLNPVAECLTGWSMSEAMERALGEVFQIVNAETDKTVDNPVDKVLREGKTVGLANHTVLIARNGERFQIADSAAPIRNGAGIITGVVLVFRDVTEDYRLQQSVHEHSQRLQRIIESAMDAVIVANEQDIILEWNPQAEALFGWSRDEIIGRHVYETIIPAALRDTHRQGIGRLIETGKTHILGNRIETAGLRRDGSEFPIELTINQLHQSTGWLFSAFIRDLTARKSAEEELRLAATTFKSHAGILITDSSGAILRVNPAFEAMTGYTAEEIVGENPRILQSGRQDKEFYQRMWSTIIKEGQWQGELWNRRKDGSLYAEWLTITAVKNPGGKITHYVGTSQDITKRKRAEARFEHLAYHDDLTDLANRRLLHDRMEHEIAIAKRRSVLGALLYLDLDRFKNLNDALGHPVGDDLLRKVGERLKMLVRTEDTVARIGGDEFVILLPMLDPDPSKASFEAQAVAEKVRLRLSEPYTLGGHRYHISPSIGIVLFPEGEGDADDLLKHADSALYRAKEEGRNTARFYQPDMQAAAEARLALEKDLRHALEHNELSLHYQPQVNGSGELIGAEALIRWQHPEQGMVPPDRFIPIAEDSGLILNIGDWVLRAAARQINTWQQSKRYTLPRRLAVNVSPRQFHQTDFVDRVVNTFNEEGVSLDHLELEITETLVMENVEDVIEKMTQLKAQGVCFSIDDFGTGYSSLSYLKRLPVDQLKIDRSFVRDIVIDADDAAIIETIIAMTRHLRLGVIAEGVETREQLDFLKEKCCTAFQGYYFSRAVPAEEFTRFFSCPILPAGTE